MKKMIMAALVAMMVSVSGQAQDFNLFIDSDGGVGAQMSVDVLDYVSPKSHTWNEKAFTPDRRYTGENRGETTVNRTNGESVQYNGGGGGGESLSVLEHMYPQNHPIIWAVTIAAFFALENNTNMDMIPNFGRDNGTSSATKAIRQYERELEEAAAAQATVNRIAELEFLLQEALSSGE